MRTIYKSKDGFDFDNKEDCELYEESKGEPLECFIEEDSSSIECPKCKIEDDYSEEFIKKHMRCSNGFLVSYLEGRSTITPYSVKKLK